MGTIARFTQEILEFRDRYRIRHFVETGTGKGCSLSQMAQLPAWGYDAFKGLWSCEIDASLALSARNRFRDDWRVRILRQRSEDFLEIICEALPDDESILFWLDAHFPGADYGLHDYGFETNDTIRLPLRHELEIIRRFRPEARDVIVCDDLRIYQDGPFQSGNVPENVRPFCPRERGIDFVHEIMGATHDVKELYDHEGYILMTPKERPNA